MKIGGLQKLTLLDYPGRTACTIFLSGCNFRCPFCHNASLVLPDREEAGICEEELFQFLRKRQGLLDGVCLTGGEPLLSPELMNFLKKIKDLGYPIKLDTNGSFPKRLKMVVEQGLVDYVAMDIKNSRECYGSTIGKENNFLASIEESVEFLLKGPVPYEFRTTVIKGFHDKKSMEQIGSWILGADQYFLQNFKDSGEIIGRIQSEYTKRMEPFSDGELKELFNTIKKWIPTASIRGE